MQKSGSDLSVPHAILRCSASPAFNARSEDRATLLDQSLEKQMVRNSLHIKCKLNINVYPYIEEAIKTTDKVNISNGNGNQLH